MGGSNSVMNKGSSQADKYQMSSTNSQSTMVSQQSSPKSSNNSLRKSFTPLLPPNSTVPDEEDDNADEVLYTSSEYMFDRELPVWFYSSNYNGSLGSRRGSLKKTRSLVMDSTSSNNREEANTNSPPSRKSTSYQKLHRQDSPPSPTHSNSSPLLFSQRPSLLTSVLKNSSAQTTPPPPKGNQVSPSHHCTSTTDFSSFNPVPSPSIPIRRVESVENFRSRSQSVPIDSINSDTRQVSKRNSITCFVSESKDMDELQILVTPPASPHEYMSPSNSLTIRSIESEMRLAKREKREKKKKILELKKKQAASSAAIMMSQASLPPLFQMHSTPNRLKSKELDEPSKQMIQVK